MVCFDGDLSCLGQVCRLVEGKDNPKSWGLYHNVKLGGSYTP